MTVPTVNFPAEAHIYVCRHWINLKPTHYIWQRRAILSALPFSFTFSSHLSDCAPPPRLSLPSALIISFSIDLLPLHPSYLMLAWLIIVPHRSLNGKAARQNSPDLKEISIVFVPSSFRAHKPVLKHAERMTFFLVLKRFSFRISYSIIIQVRHMVWNGNQN